MADTNIVAEKYEDLPLTNFPASEDTWERMSDITIAMWPLVKQYNEYFEQGNLTACNGLLANNPDLANSFINAKVMNQVMDAIKAIERFWFEDVNTFVERVAQNTVGINDNPTAEESKTVTYSAAKIDSLHKKRNITIPSSGWSNSFPYTNTVTVSGLSGDSDLKLLGLYEPANTTADQHKEWTKALGFLMENEDGVTDNAITFKAYKKPTVDFTVITEGG